MWVSNAWSGRQLLDVLCLGLLRFQAARFQVAARLLLAVYDPIAGVCRCWHYVDWDQRKNMPAHAAGQIYCTYVSGAEVGDQESPAAGGSAGGGGGPHLHRHGPHQRHRPSNRWCSSGAPCTRCASPPPEAGPSSFPPDLSSPSRIPGFRITFIYCRTPSLTKANFEIQLRLLCEAGCSTYGSTCALLRMWMLPQISRLKTVLSVPLWTTVILRYVSPPSEKPSGLPGFSAGLCRLLLRL